MHFDVGSWQIVGWAAMMLACLIGLAVALIAGTRAGNRAATPYEGRHRPEVLARVLDAVPLHALPPWPHNGYTSEIYYGNAPRTWSAYPDVADLMPSGEYPVLRASELVFDVSAKDPHGCAMTNMCVWDSECPNHAICRTLDPDAPVLIALDPSKVLVESWMPIS